MYLVGKTEVLANPIKRGEWRVQAGDGEKADSSEGQEERGGPEDESPPPPPAACQQFSLSSFPPLIFICFVQRILSCTQASSKISVLLHVRMTGYTLAFLASPLLSRDLSLQNV